MTQNCRIVTTGLCWLVALLALFSNGLIPTTSLAATSTLQSTPVTCNESKSSATPSASPITANAPFDLTYIDNAIAGHSLAIAVASVGLQRATDTEVRRMALRVAESQAGETLLLRSWRSAWYPEAQNPPANQDDVDWIVSKLHCASPSEFDALFLEMMIDLHRSAMSFANDALRNSEHPELRTFAEATIAARQSELELMAALLAEQAPATGHSTSSL